MGGTTPLYRIRYPNGSTKARDLGLELEAMGLDIERAMQTATVPPATNQARVVAPTATARDAFFGVPATEADRLALQARGAECVRTDKGWTERYFATYNANTNPLGTPAAGWYPVSGMLPIVRVGKSVSQNTSPNVGSYVPVTYEQNTFDPNGMHSTVTNTSRLVAPVGGYYRAFGQVRINTTGSANIMLAKNGAGIGDSLWALNVGATVFPSTEDVIYLNAGDYVEVWAASSAANSGVPAGHATLAYLRP